MAFFKSGNVKRLRNWASILCLQDVFKLANFLKSSIKWFEKHAGGRTKDLPNEGQTPVNHLIFRPYSLMPPSLFQSFSICLDLLGRILLLQFKY
ncbi:MAG TPA: hypothetical protein VF602_06745, partial [Pedobacter sp.]